MPKDFRQTLETGRYVRVDTLVRLRWIAIIGQTIAVLVVHFALDFTLPLGALLAATLAAVALAVLIGSLLGRDALRRPPLASLREAAG